MGTKKSSQRIEFVCVRSAHHRHAAASPCLCDVGGWHGYCPAGDVGGHDWMPTSTDLMTLEQLGYRRSQRSDEAVAREREDDDALVLIR